MCVSFPYLAHGQDKMPLVKEKSNFCLTTSSVTLLIMYGFVTFFRAAPHPGPKAWQTHSVDLPESCCSEECHGAKAIYIEIRSACACASLWYGPIGLRSSSRQWELLAAAQLSDSGSVAEAQPPLQYCASTHVCA